MNNPISEILASQVHQLKESGEYRIFSPILFGKEEPYIGTVHYNQTQFFDDVLIWCSNDYLGMSRNPDVIEAGNLASTKYGSGSSGVRSLTGTSQLHVDLETSIADFHQKENAVLYSSGFTANETAISTLANNIKNLIIFSDQLNHNSLIQGIKSGRAEKVIFNHNDPVDLREKLKRYKSDIPKMIVFESLYSMDGDFARIKQLIDVAKEYNALTYLDEVHAVGVCGPQGRGYAFDNNIDIDIISGTLGKAFGVIGGYIAGKNEIISFLKQKTPGFIFSTSMPFGSVASAIKSIEIVKKSDQLREKLKQRTQTLLIELKKNRIPVISDQSHIIAIIVGSAELASSITRVLLEKYRILVQAIKFPTVARGTERLRICAHPEMQDIHILRLVEALVEIRKEFNLEYLTY